MLQEFNKKKPNDKKRISEEDFEKEFVRPDNKS